MDLLKPLKNVSPKHKCTQCQNVFQHENDLNRHISIVHRNVENDLNEDINDYDEGNNKLKVW